MTYLVDLHIHSPYSRGTSKQMTLANLYRWAKIKGINILGTGDFTHPKWLAEIKNKLEPAEPGLLKLKNELAKKENEKLPQTIQNKAMRFILSGEVSCIYKKNNRIRKMHNIILSPDFASASKLNAKLKKIGNISSDGRPILGLDSKTLLEMMLEVNPDMFFIPAHIWTPWFSLFGSKSGFNSLNEAFDELTSLVKAVETGLSSDPFMNWRVNELRNLTMISNSDAHSLHNLGREANMINCGLNYPDLIDTLKTNDKRMIGTIEFFPEEGKYHSDGHRDCGICLKPNETKQNNGLCPKCKKPLTIGVNYRVNELAENPEDFKPAHHKKVEYIIPLMEILAEIFNMKSVNSKRTQKEYEKIISIFGDELTVLRNIPIDKIKKSGFPILAKAIQKMRAGDTRIQPGYDGVYGKIKLL